MGCWGLVVYAATGAICSGEWSPGRGLATGNVAEGTLLAFQKGNLPLAEQGQLSLWQGTGTRVSSSQGKPLQPGAGAGHPAACSWPPQGILRGL